MIERIVIIIIILSLLSFITLVMPIETENLIQNGTFNTNLSNWTSEESLNMTIGVANGFCNMTTNKLGSYTGPGPDYYLQINYTGFSTGTFYNTILHNGTNISTPTGPAWDDYMEVSSSYTNGSYLSDILYYNDAHVGGSPTNPKVNYTPYYTDWVYIYAFTARPPSATNYTISTRTGLSPTADSSWSSWTPTTFSGIAFPFGNLDAGYWIINSPASLYYQYKVEFLDSSNSLYGTWASVQTTVETHEYGQITQPVVKILTSSCNVTYKYMIEEQNNTKELYLFTRLNDETIDARNITNDVGWVTIDLDLSSGYNSPGTYELEIYSFSGFNSSNGSATVLIDNVGFYVTYPVSIPAILISLLPILIIILIVRSLANDLNTPEKKSGGKNK